MAWAALGISTVVLQDSCSGQPLQGKLVSGCWELVPAHALTLDEAREEPSCWMQIEAIREYIAFKSVTVGQSYVQFSAHSSKMVFVTGDRPRSGVREQLAVLQVNT